MRRTRWLHVGIAAVVVALLVPVAAPGQAKRTRSVDVGVKAAIVGSSGGVNTVAGTLTGRPVGSGAVVYRARPQGSELVATFRAFTRRGTLRGTTRVSPTPQPDGTTSFTGTLQITGGTGRFRGARGRDLEITGTLADDVFTFRIRGRVRY